MNYKPDESILIAYLYGELDVKENEKLQHYFQEHPEELKSVEEMAAVLKIMGTVKDKEVIAPPVFVEHTPAIPIWRSAHLKTVLSIAASLLLIIVAGRLLGTEINYSRGELRISFWGAKTEQTLPLKPQQAMTQETIQEMINATLATNNKSVTEKWTTTQSKVDQALRNSLDQNSRKVDALIKNTSLASQEQLRSFVSGLRDENLRLMKDYFQLSSTEQKKYVENLLGDFSKYLQEQREHDLTVVQSRVNSIEKNSDQFKQETEQILASIISGSSVKKNSY
jgi:hypothetical protein